MCLDFTRYLFHNCIVANLWSILLPGPPKVGRRELRQKLIGKNPDQFAPAIPRKFND